MKIPEGKVLYPISASQRVLRWSEMFSIEPRKVRENNIISGYLRVAEHADCTALELAFNELLKNNDALRLRLFRTLSRGIRQYIRDYAYVTLERFEVDGQAGLAAFTAGLSRYPIGFFAENLVWACLVQLAPGDCALVLRIHHAAIDGYSIRLVFDQLQKSYECFSQGETPPPVPVRSVLDYFELQEQYARSPQHQKDRAYWFRQYIRQRHYSYPAGYRSEKGDCASLTLQIGRQTYQSLQGLARQSGCTLQSLLMTLAAVTTCVLTGHDNFSIFTPTHGRLTHTMKQTIGCMMNTVPVFFDLDQDKPLREILPACYLKYLEALSHGRLPLGEQVPMSYPEAVKHFFNFNPAWLMFSYMEYGELFAHSKYQMEMINPTNQAHQFYLTMLEIQGERLEFDLSYQTRKYQPQTVQKILDTYAEVITLATENPQLNIRAIRDEFARREAYDDTTSPTVNDGENRRTQSERDARES